ncbi:MAG: hypothetical protein WB581_03990, partial [Halobacteriota archaeon]
SGGVRVGPRGRLALVRKERPARVLKRTLRRQITTLRHGLVTQNVNLQRGADGGNIHNRGRAHYRCEAYS